MNNNIRTTSWINDILSELSYLDNDKGVEILKQCGRDCCEASTLHKGAVSIRNQYPNEKDDDIIFKEFKSQYYNSDELTMNGNIITLIFEECTCPMVKNGVDNSFLCNCTIGYSKKVFEILFEKEVSITLEKSILGGDSVCVQHIKIS